MPAPGVREGAMDLLRYKANGSAVMTDTSFVRARGVVGRCGASPLLSMVRRPSATVVSGAIRIPLSAPRRRKRRRPPRGLSSPAEPDLLNRSSRNRHLAWRCRSPTIVGQSMAMRTREDEVFPNAAGIDIGASSHWVVVLRHLAGAAGCEPVRAAAAMTADFKELAEWLVSLGGRHGGGGIHRGVLDSGVRGAGAARAEGVAGRCAAVEVSSWAQERRQDCQ